MRTHEFDSSLEMENGNLVWPMVESSIYNCLVTQCTIIRCNKNKIIILYKWNREMLGRIYESISSLYLAYILLQIL
jgi:hypothetical protein